MYVRYMTLYDIPFIYSALYKIMITSETSQLYSHDRIVVSTSRCGRDNPGSNPGHGSAICR